MKLPLRWSPNGRFAQLACVWSMLAMLSACTETQPNPPPPADDVSPEVVSVDAVEDVRPTVDIIPEVIDAPIEETIEPTDDTPEPSDAPPGPCNEIMVDSYVIQDKTDVEALGETCRIDGNLTIVETGLTALDLPHLTHVGSQLKIHDNADLSSVSLPVLTEVGKGLLFKGNPQLSMLHLPALATVGDELKIYYNAQLQEVSFPELSMVGNDLDVWNNASLTTLHCPSLSMVNFNLIVQDNPLLGAPALVLPALAEVVGNLWLSGNGDLSAFEMPILAKVGDTVSVLDNVSLTSFDLSSLEHVGGSLAMNTNPHLAQCLVDSLVAQLEPDGIGNDMAIEDNKNDCSCTEVNGALEASCP